MSGIKSGLQTQIKKISANAIYVHCCAHVLNLFTMEAKSVNSDVQLFFGTAEKLYAFLTSSLHTLKEHQKSQYESTVDTLKRLSDTRCASRRHAVHAVVGSFSAILATLDSVNQQKIK